MSSDPPKDPKDNTNSKKLHIWGRPLDQPPPNQEPPADATKPPLTGDDFQRNFPEASGTSLSDAVKTIKPEDFLEVHRSACGRQGLMAGIVAGAVLGGLRFVWRGTPLKAANWAVGGFVAGATVGFERCQYLRRLERISMKRIVEVHQADVEEKRRIKEAEEAEARRKAQEKKTWYKFW